MFKLYASRTVGRNVEVRTGEAYTINGLKFAAANLVYVLLGKNGFGHTAQVHAFVDNVRQACAEGRAIGVPHRIVIAGVTLAITMERETDYVR